jgi:hypothetical protein
MQMVFALESRRFSSLDTAVSQPFLPTTSRYVYRLFDCSYLLDQRLSCLCLSEKRLIAWLCPSFKNQTSLSYLLRSGSNLNLRNISSCFKRDDSIMLDLQRHRSCSRSLAGASFASGLVLAHLVCGATAAALMVFHQLFFAALVVAGWFLCSICIVVGMMNHQQWCRILLAAWFLLGALAGLGYLLYAPSLPKPVEMITETLPQTLLPFWLSTFVLAYVAGAGVLLMSRRIERATMRGFRLWDLPRD